MLSSGSNEYISAGGTASGTVLSGGAQYDAGSAVSTTVLGAGFLAVQAGGVASGTVLSNGVIYVQGTARIKGTRVVNS